MADKRDSIAVDVTCACGAKYSTRRYTDGEKELAKKRCSGCAFEELANSRTNNALHHIDLLGNLAKPQYKYGQGDVDMIVDALSDAVVILSDKFNKPVKNAKQRFTLRKEVNPATIEQLNTV